MTLEQKAKARRAEAFQKYSGRMKGQMDVMRAAKKKKDRGKNKGTATLLSNPMNTGTLGRYAHGGKAGM